MRKKKITIVLQTADGGLPPLSDPLVLFPVTILFSLNKAKEWRLAGELYSTWVKKDANLFSGRDTTREEYVYAFSYLENEVTVNLEFGKALTTTVESGRDIWNYFTEKRKFKEVPV